MNRQIITALLIIVFSALFSISTFANTQYNLQELTKEERQSLAYSFSGLLISEQAINTQINAELIAITGQYNSLLLNAITGSFGFSRHSSSHMHFWPFDDAVAKSLLPLPDGYSNVYIEIGFGEINTDAELYQARAVLYARYWAMLDYERDVFKLL